MMVDHGLRLAGLWMAWLLVMLYHVELGLMPLFHGVSVEIKSHVPPGKLPAVFMAMLAYFLLPLLALLLTIHAISAPLSWSNGIGWRSAQFWFSVGYTVSNVLHLIADIRIPDSRSDQILLMFVLTAIGLLINREAWLWWRG
jgi:hypothetical protein